MTNHPLAVTVVVPVFNAGPYLEHCSPSLLDQSIGSDHYEVVYVDDGSTDGSGAFLDDLAREHAHVRVHHQENSGWPGKPRNVGVAMARGEFVQFVDQDDRLAPRALERLVDLGRRSGADIVVGKTAGTMVGPRRLFREGVEGASVVDSGVAQSLTGHKMFRTDFLRENGIAFPEGYWRLEDILFSSGPTPATRSCPCSSTTPATSGTVVKTAATTVRPASTSTATSSGWRSSSGRSWTELRRGRSATPCCIR